MNWADVATPIRVLILVGATALLATLGLLKVHRQNERVRVGYEFAEATNELGRLQERDRRLRLEISVLTHPARIERLAHSLGMVRPNPEQIRNVNVTRRTEGKKKQP